MKELPTQFFCPKCGGLTDYPSLLIIPSVSMWCRHCNQTYWLEFVEAEIASDEEEVPEEKEQE